MPTVIDLESRSTFVIGIESLMHEGALSIYPYVEDRGLLFVQIRKKKAHLSAGAFIGLIPLTPQIIVNVKPKLPVNNLGRVLDTSRGILTAISGVERNYLQVRDNSSSILDYLSSNLTSAVRPIITNGLIKLYERNTTSSTQPRGHVDIKETLLRCWTRGKRHLVTTSNFDHSADVAMNRVIKSALSFILTHRTGLQIKSVWRREASAQLSLMPNSIGHASESDIEICKIALDTGRIPSNKSYYNKALNISLLILDGKSISVQNQGNDITLDTFIVNFEDIFERYVRNVLLDRSPSNIWVRDGNKEGRKPLFDDVKSPPAQPDVVLVHSENNKKIVLEVKYKEKPNRDDYNQAITYALSYRTKAVVLIHQKGPARAGGLQTIGKICDIQLLSYAIDLAAADLELQEQSLANVIFGLLSDV